MSDKAYILIGLISAFTTIIVAIISQIISMNIKAKSQIKANELELYFKERNKAYNDFVCSFSIILELTGYDDKYLQFVQCYYAAYLLATNNTRDNLSNFFHLISEALKKGELLYSYQEIESLFNNVCESMRDDLQHCYTRNYKRKKAKRKSANPKKKSKQ